MKMKKDAFSSRKKNPKNENEIDSLTFLLVSYTNPKCLHIIDTYSFIV